MGNRYAFVQSASVFSAFYNDVGIFGIYGSTSSDCMPQLVGAICAEAKKMATSISEAELKRAKNQLKSSLLMNLESRSILFEDLVAVSQAMLKTPPSIAVY